MPQAFLVPLFTALGAGTAAVALSTITQVVLMNVMLGGLEFEDDDGEVWHAA